MDKAKNKQPSSFPERLTLLNNLSLVYPIPNNYMPFNSAEEESGNKLEKLLTELSIIVGPRYFF